MSEPPRIDDLPAALAGRAFPTVGQWNRLEGRPRTTDFARALRVEVRDPLWMLTRQWQLGEFRGTDGGSPVTATYSVATVPPTRFRPGGGAAGDLPADRPLEAVAERRPVPFAFGADRISFDLRLAIGRRWLKLVGRSPLLRLLNIRQQYVTRYPIALPNPASDADTPRVAHPEVWASMQAVAGRRMDGYLLYQHLKGGGHAADGITGLLNLHRPALAELGARLVAWFEALIDQPAGDDAWDPRRLEHRFSVAATGPAGGEKVLTAQEYPGGRLDWHAFSIDPGGPLGGTDPAPPPINRTVFPAPVRFSGMPLPRWWAVEDGRTNFAAVRPDSTDLARLIFLEFALVYSNDWFHLPCDLPAGTLAEIRGLAVTDVFGQQLWITPAGAGDDQDWQRWSMFTLDTIGDESVPADTGLFLPPVVPKVADGPVLEDVALIRDENANLVWGIERTVRQATGEGRRGSEVAAEVLAHRRRLFPPEPPGDPRAAVAYEAMNSIPENWIPFIPVHVPGDNRSIQLQRAALPGAIDGVPVRPRTALLREGFDAGQPYFVNEEEVPQSGTVVTVAYNRTRWTDGRVVLWLSARRGTGRGEGSSGLAFDSLIDT
ncbi:hypothetical protein DPM19_23535 [Actinomadura craniellae]|uniref:Uncharacterized protein n=1 Tax=Actinomadura craniellae TaxID=2231787 RepID=A0A365H0M7_9ACTN|nr:hypothetical protein [Actinomadura craniellae]RAY12578.1 hypothetical protein DPM19_23535 [Actinomadura craniellae]